MWIALKSCKTTCSLKWRLIFYYNAIYFRLKLVSVLIGVFVAMCILFIYSSHLEIQFALMHMYWKRFV